MITYLYGILRLKKIQDVGFGDFGIDGYLVSVPIDLHVKGPLIFSLPYWIGTMGLSAILLEQQRFSFF